MGRPAYSHSFFIFRASAPVNPCTAQPITASTSTLHLRYLANAMSFERASFTRLSGAVNAEVRVARPLFIEADNTKAQWSCGKKSFGL